MLINKSLHNSLKFSFVLESHFNSYFRLYLFRMQHHSLPYGKLKMNKFERMKSRYKTQAGQLNQSEDQSYQIPQSQQFSKVYNRLSNHFNVNLLPKKLYTQKDEYISQQQMLKRSNNSFSHKVRPSHIKSLSGEHQSHSPSKLNKKPNSLNRPFLPAVKMVTDPSHTSKLSKSNKLYHASVSLALNKNFILFEGLMLHVHNVATIYNRLRRNLNMESIMSAVEQYVLESNNSDVSKLDLLFIVEQIKLQCKLFIFLERMIIIYIVESQIKKLKTQKSALKILLHLICDHYVTLLNLLYNQSYNIEKSYIKKILSLMGVDDELQFKDKKLFLDNQDLILRLNNLLKGNHSFRGYFHDQLPKIAMMSINQTFYTILEHYSFTLSQNFTICPQIVKFLSTCPSPYVHTQPTKDYTLVMDLDETLIHYDESKATLLVRPHCKKFLTQLAQFFQIGIFTCAMPDYANWVLNELKCPISFRLYRHHTVQNGNSFFKDLNRLGRDIKKMIIVDNIADNFNLTPKNGIHIKGWTGQCQDRELLYIMDKLLTLIKLSPDDVRVCLSEILKNSTVQQNNIQE